MRVSRFGSTSTVHIRHGHEYSVQFSSPDFIGTDKLAVFKVSSYWTSPLFELTGCTESSLLYV